MDTQKTNLLDIFIEHVAECDWLEGLDLYQSGKVNHLSDFSGLITAKVFSNIRGSSEVRLKIHPSGKRIQWMECTCSKYRRSGQYCEHMAAFMINIDREKPQLFGSLDSKMPLKPPTSNRKTKPTHPPPQQTRSIDKLEGAAQTILSHLSGQIHSVTLLAKGPSIRVRLEIKQGTLTHYNLDIDSAAKFLQSNPKIKTATEDIKALRVYGSSVLKGTYLTQADHENIIAERVFAIRHNTKSFQKAIEIGNDLGTNRGPFMQYSLNNPKGRNGLFEFISVKTASKYIGKEFIFLPGRGYWPIDDKITDDLWSEQPLKKTYKNDEAAKLVQTGFQDLLGAGPIWLDQNLENPQIKDDLTLKEISIHRATDGWFYLDPKYSSGETSVSMIDLMEHFNTKKRSFLKAGNSWLKIPEFVKDMDWELDQSGKYLRVNTVGLMRLKAAVGDFDKFVGRKSMLSKIRDKLEFKPIGKLPSLAGSKLRLRGYQNTGLEWLWWLYTNGLHGLLADEMGLGKTHQAMALMSSINAVKPQAKFLVVCPTTVIDHWVDKISEFAPDLKPHKHHGSKRLQAFQPSNEDLSTVVTSYGVLLRDIKILAKHPFEVIVLDEAHFIKNNVTATYKAVCQLDSQFRICLTGTPMENHLGELKNIFDFLIPGYLGSDEYFKKNFITPIQENGNSDDEYRLQKLIHPFKMRRTKELVLKELPAKVEDFRHCELSKDQASLYREILQLKATPLVKQLEDDSTPISYLHVFHLLTLLKQICNHPALVKKTLDYKKYESGKFEALKEVIGEALDSNHKVVIYSQYVGMIDIIDRYLSDENIDHAVMTGQSKNRGQIINHFQTNKNCKIFCASLLAGGIGIDLTAASVVIHYDRWWNASKENQATDRVHRIGQQKNVQVFKFLTKGTLEEKIDLIIKSKQSLFERFMDRDEELFKKLSRQQLIDLLT